MHEINQLINNEIKLASTKNYLLNLSLSYGLTLFRYK